MKGKSERRHRIKMARLTRMGKYLQWWFAQGGRSPAALSYAQWSHLFMRERYESAKGVES